MCNIRENRRKQQEIRSISHLFFLFGSLTMAQIFENVPKASKVPSLLSAHAGISSLFSLFEKCVPLLHETTLFCKNTDPHAWIREQRSKSAHLPDPTHPGTKYPRSGEPLTPTQKRKVATKTISYERYGEILFQKVASCYLDRKSVV